MDSLTKELKAFIEDMENPVAVDNGDGTSKIKSGDDSVDVDGVSNESLDDFMAQSHYGDRVEHGRLRHNRQFEVRDNTLYIN